MAQQQSTSNEIVIIRSSNMYASNRDFVMQALDPSNTFADAVRSGEWTRENADQQAHNYLAFYLADGTLEQFEGADEDLAWNETTFSESALAAYIVSLIDEHEAETTTLSVSDSVLAKLDITADQLNSMYAADPVNGFVGTQVAAEIAERFSIDASEPLGYQLAERGILTDEEAEYLDDDE